MKIINPQGREITVSIQNTNGHILLMSEDAAGAGIQGQVVKATSHEIELLRSSQQTRITIDVNFRASDEEGA